MYKLTSVLVGTVVAGGALLAFASPASAQGGGGYPCYGCGDTPRVEAPAADTSPAGFAALGGLTAAGLAALALRRRRTTDPA